MKDGDWGRYKVGKASKAGRMIKGQVYMADGHEDAVRMYVDNRLWLRDCSVVVRACGFEKERVFEVCDDRSVRMVSACSSIG